MVRALIAKAIILLSLGLLGQGVCAADGPMAIISLKNNPDRNLYARDLVCAEAKCGDYRGRVLTYDEIQNLIKNRVIKEASELSPVTDSILWADTYADFPYQWLWRETLNYPVQADAPNEVDDFSDGKAFEYFDLKPSVIHRVGLTLQKENPTSHQIENYSLIIGPEAHNFLARKALLRKIGYFVPPVQFMPRVRIHFDDKFRAIRQNELISKVVNSTGVDPRKWFTNVEQVCPSKDAACFFKVQNGADTIEVQDAILLKGADDDFYNLARGVINHANIRDRRLLNAAVIPFVLTDFVPLVNFVAWTPGRVFNDNLLLPFEFGEEFSATADDARWVMRRILKLSRADFAEIIAAMHLPAEVSALLVEKLISRRNWMRRTLMPGEGSDLPFTTKLSISDVVVGGLLKKNVGQGYATVFYDPETDNPKNPLSMAEVFSFLRSKVFSNVISNALARFNSDVLPRTDIGYKVFDHQLDLSAKQFVDFLMTGEVHRVPFGYFKVPYFDDGLIVSRELVIGSFMGSDNSIQLADTFGFQVGGGLYVRTDGMPTNETLSARNRIYTYWTYTHMRPALSVKAAVKEPMIDVITPLVRHDSENVLAQANFSKLSDEDKKALQELQAKYERGEQIFSVKSELQDKVTQILEAFSKSMGPGDSFVITKYFGHQIEVDYTKGLSSILSAQARLSDDFKVIERIHFLRKDEKTIQIYRTPGHMNTIGLDLDLNMYLPILALDWRRNCGRVNSNFFTINIDGRLNSNPYIFENLNAFLQALRTGSTEHLKFAAVEPKEHLTYLPVRVGHDFCEKEFGLNFLTLDYERQKVADDIRVTAPDATTSDIAVESKGYRRGVNYQKFSLDAVNALIREYGDPTIQVSSQNNGNPADTILGHAFTKKTTFESEKNELGEAAPFININYQWRGWSLTREKLEKVLVEMRSHWGSELFRPEQLSNIDKVLLYSVSYDLNLYEAGLQHMAAVSEKSLRDIYRRKGRYKYADQQRTEMVIYGFMANQKQFLKYLAVDPHKAGKAAIALFLNAEAELNFDGMLELVGGYDNLMLQATLNGFKKGDPNGQTPIVSDTVGKVGSAQPFGPTRFYMGKNGMNASEFNLYWLINKL